MKKIIKTITITLLLLTTIFGFTKDIYAYNVGTVQFGKVSQSYFSSGSTSEYSIFQYSFEFNNEWYQDLRFLTMSIIAVGPDVDTFYPIGATDYQLNVMFGSGGVTVGYVDMLVYRTNLTPGLETIQLYYNGAIVWDITLSDMGSDSYYIQTQDILTFNFDMYQRGYNEAKNEYGYLLNNIWITASEYAEIRYNSGLLEGNQNGYELGYDEGYDDSKQYYGNYFDETWLTAYQFGQIRYNEGYNKGLSTEVDWFSWAITFITMPVRVLNIEVLPGVKIGYFALFTLLTGLVSWFFFLVGKGKK